jgi:hypothetical protein
VLNHLTVLSSESPKVIHLYSAPKVQFLRVALTRTFVVIRPTSTATYRESQGEWMMLNYCLEGKTSPFKRLSWMLTLVLCSGSFGRMRPLKRKVLSRVASLVLKRIMSRKRRV